MQAPIDSAVAYKRFHLMLEFLSGIQLKLNMSINLLKAALCGFQSQSTKSEFILNEIHDRNFWIYLCRCTVWVNHIQGFYHSIVTLLLVVWPNRIGIGIGVDVVLLTFAIEIDKANFYVVNAEYFRILIELKTNQYEIRCFDANSHKMQKYKKIMNLWIFVHIVC